MRIVTWNCWSGECRSRAARLAQFQPDLVILQECSVPSPAPDQHCLWFGNNPQKGVGIVADAGRRLDLGSAAPAILDSTYPVRVSGPTDFHLLAVWAQKRPTYVQAIIDGLNHYRAFLTEGPAVVVGDFNSHSQFNVPGVGSNHTDLVDKLCADFGLVSAFHNSPPHLGLGAEPPTLYWYWDQQKPYHIDYCFIPQNWVSRIQRVEVGNYVDWATENDHRPLLVELDLP